MKSLFIVLCIFVSVATGCTEHDQGRTPVPLQPPVKAPAVTADCSSLIFNMVDCVTFLGNGGNEMKPEVSCCSGFKMAAYKDADCICKALKISVILGVDVNVTKAMKLPSACGLSSFKLSDCKVLKNSSIAAPPPKSPVVPTPIKTPAAPSGHARTPDVSSGNAGTPGHRAPPLSHASNGAYATHATLSILFSVVVLSHHFLSSNW